MNQIRALHQIKVELAEDTLYRILKIIITGS